MQRKPQLVLLVAVLLAGVLLGRALLQQDGQQDGQQGNTDPDSNMPTASPIASVNPVVEQIAERSAEQPADSLANILAERPVNLWTTSNTSPNVYIPGAQSNVKGAVQIQYDTSRLRNLQYGDDLLIEVPQKDTRYHLNIEKVVDHPGGIKVVQARQNDDVRLILTLGRKNTFANLATLDGNFELVGNTDTGWLMPTAYMDSDLDPSIPDFVVLPQSQVQIQTLDQTQEKIQILN